MALALTGIHELTVIRGYQRQSEAIEGSGRQSEAIKGNQRQSETIRGNEIRGNQRRSEVIRGDQRQSEVSVTVCACHYCVCGLGNTAPHFVCPNLLPVAPTIASHGPAGLGVLGVETVDTETGGHRRKKASFFDVSGNNKCGYVNVREITGQITGQYVRASA